MTAANVADFLVYLNDPDSVDLCCPECLQVIPTQHAGATIRDLIHAAQAHNAEIRHPTSHHAGTMRA